MVKIFVTIFDIFHRRPVIHNTHFCVFASFCFIAFLNCEKIGFSCFRIILRKYSKMMRKHENPENSFVVCKGPKQRTWFFFSFLEFNFKANLENNTYFLLFHLTQSKRIGKYHLKLHCFDMINFLQFFLQCPYFAILLVKDCKQQISK